MTEFARFARGLLPVATEKILTVAPAPVDDASKFDAARIFVGPKEEALRPLRAGFDWLKQRFYWQSPEHALKAYGKLSLERKAIVLVGLSIELDDAYGDAPCDQLFARPIMFVSQPRSLAEFPVATLTCMGFDVYQRLSMAGSAA